MILHRAGDNFRSRSCIVVHQNHQRRAIGIIVRRCVGAIVQTIAAFLRENRLAGRKKSLGNVNRLLEKSAGVIPQIEHQRVHSPRLQEVERILQSLRGVVIKAPRHVDIADARANDVRIGDRWLWHCIASDVHNIRFAGGDMRDRQLHQRAPGSANLVTHFGGRLAMHRYTIDRVDAIAITKASAEGGRFIESSSDIRFDLIANQVVLNRRADTEVLAALISLHLVELFFIEIVRVRIQRAQHADDRGLVDVVEIQLITVDVVMLNGTQRLAEILRDSCGRTAIARPRTPGSAAWRRI